MKDQMVNQIYAFVSILLHFIYTRVICYDYLALYQLKRVCNGYYCRDPKSRQFVPNSDPHCGFYMLIDYLKYLL